MERARCREGKRSRRDTEREREKEWNGGRGKRREREKREMQRTKVSIVTPARLCAPSLSLSFCLSSLFSVPRWFFSSFVAIHEWTSSTSLSFYACSRHYARTAVSGNGWRDPRRGILKVLGWLPHFQNSSFRSTERFSAKLLRGTSRFWKRFPFVSCVIKTRHSWYFRIFVFKKRCRKECKQQYRYEDFEYLFNRIDCYFMTCHYCFIEDNLFIDDRSREKWRFMYDWSNKKLNILIRSNLFNIHLKKPLG